MSDTSEIPFVLEENHTIPLVEIVFAARGGTASDKPGLEGALSLALRSLRRGAGSRLAREIDETFDRLGADFGASADVQGANIHGRVIRRNLEPFLDLVAELVLHPTFPEHEIAQVIRETRADIVDARDDDRSLAGRAFRRMLFAGHPSGRPSGGTLETLNTLTRETAIESYKTALVTGNLVFAAAGDITPVEVERIVRSRFASIPVGPSRMEQPPEPKAPKGRHLLIVDKPERTQTQIFIGGMGTHPRDPDHVALRVANTAFGGTFTARLMREVRSKRGWSYGASSRLGHDRSRESWYMSTAPASTDAAACIELQLQMLEDLVENGITERELSLAKNYIIRGYAFEVDTAPKRLGLTLDEMLTPLPKGTHAKFVSQVKAVTRQQANAALRKRLSADDLLVSIVATAKDLRGPVEKAIKRLASTQVQPFDVDVIHREPVLPTR